MNSLCSVVIEENRITYDVYSNKQKGLVRVTNTPEEFQTAIGTYGQLEGISDSIFWELSEQELPPAFQAALVNGLKQLTASFVERRHSPILYLLDSVERIPAAVEAISKELASAARRFCVERNFDQLDRVIWNFLHDGENCHDMNPAIEAKLVPVIRRAALEISDRGETDSLRQLQNAVKLVPELRQAAVPQRLGNPQPV